MIPEEFRQRIAGQAYINTGSILKALEEPSPVSIRINPAKWDKRPAERGKVPWCEMGYYLNERPLYTIDPLFHAGCYYPQEASGMFLEHVLRQTEVLSGKTHVLDLCAAPGGKSTHIASLIGENSMLVSNEVIRSRRESLIENVTRWGLSNVIITGNDPSAFGRVPACFDIILVDAPCSGEGMFRDEIATREWSVGKTIVCAGRQRRILKDVWPSLREDGIMIYSTCTFNPSENEENIKWFVENHEAESVRVDISDFKGIKEIEFNGISGYGFYPGMIKGEGLFISVIRKREKEKRTEIKSSLRHNLKLLKKEEEVALRWTGIHPERLIRLRDIVYALPCSINDYLYLLKNLTVIRPGTKLYTIKKNDYIPSHELAVSTVLNRDVFPSRGNDLREALSYLRRDPLMPDGLAKGWNIITYKGINLGFVKSLGTRTNNYYPVDWRIRMDIDDKKAGRIIKWENDG